MKETERNELKQLWVGWLDGTKIKGVLPRIKKLENTIPSYREQYTIYNEAYREVFGMDCELYRRLYL